MTPNLLFRSRLPFPPTGPHAVTRADETFSIFTAISRSLCVYHDVRREERPGGMMNETRKA